MVIDPGEIELKAGRVYALENGGGETTVKRFMLDPPRLVPVSSNPLNQPILLGQEPVRVIGRVVFTGLSL